MSPETEKKILIVGCAVAIPTLAYLFLRMAVQMNARQGSLTPALLRHGPLPRHPRDRAAPCRIGIFIFARRCRWALRTLRITPSVRRFRSSRLRRRAHAARRKDV